MLDSGILDVALGLVFFYLLLSLLTTTLTEMVATMRQMRPRNLYEGIQAMLDDRPSANGSSSEPAEQRITGEKLYKHPLIESLGPTHPKHRPSYIAPRTFSRALLDTIRYEVPDEVRPLFETDSRLLSILRHGKVYWVALETFLARAKSLDEQYRQGGKSLTKADLLRLVDQLPEDKPLKDLIRAFVNSVVPTDGAITCADLKSAYHTAKTFIPEKSRVRRQLEVVLAHAESLEGSYLAMEAWFNDQMDRVSGWYKREVRRITLVIALLLVLTVNGDTVMIANYLLVNPIIRTGIADSATAYIAENQADAIVTPAPAGDDGGTAPIADPVQQLEQMTDRARTLQAEITNLYSFIGWSGERESIRGFRLTTWGWIYKVIGLAVSVIAVSLGAPFWFDILKKLVNLRGAGKVAQGDYPSPPPAPPPAINLTLNGNGQMTSRGNANDGPQPSTAEQLDSRGGASAGDDDRAEDDLMDDAVG